MIQVYLILGFNATIWRCERQSGLELKWFRLRDVNNQMKIAVIKTKIISLMLILEGKEDK